MAYTRTLTKDIGTTNVDAHIAGSLIADIVIGMRITNTTSTAIKVSAFVRNTGVNYYLVGGADPATTGADIPVGGSLVVVNGDADKVIMIAGDTLKVISNTATSCDCIVSVTQE